MTLPGNTLRCVRVDFKTESGTYSALYQADMNAPNGTGVGALLIRDTQGTTVFAGAQAWICAMPKTSLGKKLGDVEWKLRVASLEGFVG